MLDLRASPPPPPAPPATPRPIAAWLHTAFILALLVGTTTAGRMRTAAPTHHASNTLRYVSSIVLEWVLLGLVIAGIRQRKAFLLQAFRSKAQTLSSALSLGLMVYVMGFMAIACVALIIQLTPLARHSNEAVVLALLPHSPLQFFLWFLVSLTAGICEELIFRGYLLQQFTAWTNRPILAVLITALLFGSVHLYEGLAAILPLSALAIVYGLVVRHFRGDLRMVIIAHTLQDFFVAVLALARPWLEAHATRH